MDYETEAAKSYNLTNHIKNAPRFGAFSLCNILISLRFVELQLQLPLQPLLRRVSQQPR